MAAKRQQSATSASTSSPRNAPPANTAASSASSTCPNTRSPKADIDSFFTASASDRFTSGMIVSTTDNGARTPKTPEQPDQARHPPRRPRPRRTAPSTGPSSTLAARRRSDSRPRTTLRPHQKRPSKDVIDRPRRADRGKLIMACGTGKTFTALKIAEDDRARQGGARAVPRAVALPALADAARVDGRSDESRCTASPSARTSTSASDAEGRRRHRRHHHPRPAFPATTNAKQLVRQYEHSAHGEESKATGADDGRLLHLPVHRRRRRGAESRACPSST